ncbi:MAG: LysM peptidoglycan-binding domain-containing protein, partial [Caldilineaceae bacterium]|nr:LysM peptidoglycan-binding domain-containing protein [Caldilineaceae bacterium]
MPACTRLLWRLSHRPFSSTLIILLSLFGLALYGPTSFGPTILYAQSDSTPVDESSARPVTVVDTYEYVVQPGDIWSTVANRTGLTVRALQEANPQAVRRSGYLIEGERLTIPDRIATTTHVVQRGESWTVIAKEYDISYYLLKAVNPTASRYGDVLRLGDTLTVPLLNEDITVIGTISADDVSADDVSADDGTPAAGADEAT